MRSYHFNCKILQDLSGSVFAQVFQSFESYTALLQAAEAAVLRRRAEASAVLGKNWGVIEPQTSDAQLTVALNTWQTCSCKGKVYFSHLIKIRTALK